MDPNKMILRRTVAGVMAEHPLGALPRKVHGACVRAGAVAF